MADPATFASPTCASPTCASPRPGENWLALAAALIAVALFACACASAPKRRLASDVTVGSFAGAGGAELEAALSAREAPGSGRRLKLDGMASLAYETKRTSEKVAEDESSFSPAVFESDTLSSTLTARWTLSDLGTGAVVRAGETSDTLKRVAGGWLASQGAAPETVPGEAEARKILAGALADQIIEEIGPALDASAIERAGDERSKKALSLASAGNWDEAAVLWRELIGLNPDYAAAHYNLGLHHERLGELEEAWASYRLAFLSEAIPLHRSALTRLTDSLERLGRLPKPSGSSL